jgi:hypothetical protein
MTKAPSPDALASARTAACKLRELNTALVALLYGALTLIEQQDNVNGIELLEIAIERVSSIRDFQALNEALDEMGAAHE